MRTAAGILTRLGGTGSLLRSSGTGRGAGSSHRGLGGGLGSSGALLFGAGGVGRLGGGGRLRFSRGGSSIALILELLAVVVLLGLFVDDIEGLRTCMYSYESSMFSNFHLAR